MEKNLTDTLGIQCKNEKGIVMALSTWMVPSTFFFLKKF